MNANEMCFGNYFLKSNLPSSSHFALAGLPYSSSTHPKQEAGDVKDAGERSPYAARCKLTVIVKQKQWKLCGCNQVIVAIRTVP